MLVWAALLGYGLKLRSDITTQQAQLQDELVLLYRRRTAAAEQTKLLAEKEQEIASKPLANCVCKELPPVVSSSNDARLAAMEDRVRLANEKLSSLAAQAQELTHSLAQCREAQRRLELAASSSAALASPSPSPSSLHGHRSRPDAKPMDAVNVTALKLAAGNATAPPFLEPLAKKWSFGRDANLEVGYLTLMPWPVSVSFSAKVFVEVGELTLAAWDETEFARAAIERFSRRFSALKEQGRAAHCVHESRCEWRPSQPFVVEIACSKRAPAVPAPEPDESYSMKVEAGKVRLEAAEAVGVLRGLATLLQLFTKKSGSLSVVSLPLVTISNDKPAYSWRGAMLDVARHFHPVEQIVSLLDGMELVKLNVLHWHLSDDQGFRLEVRTLPELHLKGSAGEFFTHEQVERVVREAALRGIRVVPEVDMPGHVGAILLAYPDLGSSGAPSQPDTNWGLRPWVLDPSSEKVYEFVEALLSEMASLFPDDYVHIGGDEVPEGAWSSSAIRKWMGLNQLRTQHEVQLHFNRRLASMLGSKKRRMMGWDEITVDWLPKNVTVQLWRSWMPDVFRKVADLGLSSVASHELYLDWVRPIKHYYKHDVSPSKGRIGGEACMWSEWASSNIDNRLWPTLAAVAEKLWLSTEAPGGVQHMYARIFGISDVLSAAGVRHDAVLTLALRTLQTGTMFSDQDLRSFSPPSSDSEADVVLRRLVNALQPVNRVGGGEKHPLTHLADALRPDSLEMRALAMLLEECVKERFADVSLFSLARASLSLYASLQDEMARVSLFDSAQLAGTRQLARSISEVAAGAVAVMDGIGRGETMREQRDQLLKTIGRVENSVVNGDKVIVEVAHVIETSFLLRI